MQANGAEMLRLACCLATERGIEVCAPVHDAVLICAPPRLMVAAGTGLPEYASMIVPFSGISGPPQAASIDVKLGRRSPTGPEPAGACCDHRPSR